MGPSNEKARFGITGYFLLAVSAALFSVCSESGDDMTTTSAVPSELMGWRVSDTVETYDRESIFDYINGAGEVYRSYAFVDVKVHRYTKPDGPEIVAEIFDMGSSDDAYGVFSYTRESEEQGIGSAFERRGSVLCFWQSQYYVCVVAYKVSDEVRTAIDSLARTIAGRLPKSGGVPNLISLLPKENRVAHTERFFHIHPSLNYHYYLAEQNILKLSEQTNAVLASYEPGATFLLCVEYPTGADAQAAHRSFMDSYLPEAAGEGAVKLENNLWTGVNLADRYLIVSFDATERIGAMDLIENMKTNLRRAGVLSEDDHE